MAAAPNDGTLRRPSAPLGAILVERGVLTQEQLAAALAEQERSGEQLGAIVVRLGFTLPPMIGQGLATQHGGLLKTEYGYAVGFGGGTTAPHADPPPVSPEPTGGEPSARLRLVSAARATPPSTSAPISALAPAEALSTPPASTPDDDVLKWQQRAQELATQRDTALRDLQALEAERIASAAELEAATSRIAELEAVATQTETDPEALARARDEAASRTAELERKLEELEAAAAHVTELEAAVALAQVETTRLERAREEAASRNSELERQLVELQAVAAARDRELAAARARLAELEAARAAGEDGNHALSSNLEAEVARVQMEKADLVTARDALASRNAELEDRLKTLEAAEARTGRLERQRVEASAKIRQLEAERDDALLVARNLREQQREHDHDEHAKDPSHLIFAPVHEGYLLFEQDGPPPALGTTLEFNEEDGTSSRLLVAKIGAAPLPGIRLACAYLIETE
jgi:chemotaxis protein histidine kinase CheA